MEVDEERFRLEQEAEDLINDDPENERLHQVYERLDDLDADKAEAKAARILKGLGFNKGLYIVILALINFADDNLLKTKNSTTL